MKVIYNLEEVVSNNTNYEQFVNLPMLNSQEIVGVITLNDINAFNKEQVDTLISSSRAIEITDTLPVSVLPNTLYYIGPDANDLYIVYLVDEVRNVFNIGTTSFYEYYAGTGIEIDEDNFIYVKIDNQTIIVDSEGNLHAVLDVNKIDVMRGATDSEGGYKGLVPAPQIADREKALSGSGTWANAGATQAIINAIWPVGSIYLSMDNTNPGTFMKGADWGTTWVKLESPSGQQEGYTFWSDSEGSTSTSGEKISTYGSAPAVYHTADIYKRIFHLLKPTETATSYYNTLSGFYFYGSGNKLLNGQGFYAYKSYLYIDARYNSSVYTNDWEILRPRAIVIHAWRRSA